MRRLWATGATIVICLVLGGTPVVGQEESPASSADPTPTRLPALPPAQPSDLALTVLYDNVSDSPDLTADWGFSALVEYGSHRLLFDTGAVGSILLANMEQLGVDPHSIEAVILSHEHYDHTGGLQALLDTGARPTVYAPGEFRDSFKERVRDQTELVEVTDPVEVVPGVHTTRPTGVDDGRGPGGGDRGRGRGHHWLCPSRSRRDGAPGASGHEQQDRLPGGRTASLNRPDFDGDSKSWRNMESWQTTQQQRAPEPAQVPTRAEAAGHPHGAGLV